MTTVNAYTGIQMQVTERFFPEGWSEPGVKEVKIDGADEGKDAKTKMVPVGSVPQFGSARQVGAVLVVTPTMSPGAVSMPHGSSAVAHRPSLMSPRLALVALGSIHTLALGSPRAAAFSLSAG